MAQETPNKLCIFCCLAFSDNSSPSCNAASICAKFCKEVLFDGTRAKVDTKRGFAARRRGGRGRSRRNNEDDDEEEDVCDSRSFDLDGLHLQLIGSLSIGYLSACKDCLKRLENVSEARVKAEAVEVKVRDLQRRVLKELKELQKEMVQFYLEMGEMQEIIRLSDVTCLQTQINKHHRLDWFSQKNCILAFRKEILKVSEELTDYRESISTKLLENLPSGSSESGIRTTEFIEEGQEFENECLDFDNDEMVENDNDGSILIPEAIMEPISSEVVDSDPDFEASVDEEESDEDEDLDEDWSQSKKTKTTKNRDHESSRTRSGTKESVEKSARNNLKERDIAKFPIFRRRLVRRIIRLKLEKGKKTLEEDKGKRGKRLKLCPFEYDSETGHILIGEEGIQVYINDSDHTLTCSQCSFSTGPNRGPNEKLVRIHGHVTIKHRMLFKALAPPPKPKLGPCEPRKFDPLQVAKELQNVLSMNLAAPQSHTSVNEVPSEHEFPVPSMSSTSKSNASPSQTPEVKQEHEVNVETSFDQLELDDLFTATTSEVAVNDNPIKNDAEEEFEESFDSDASETEDDTHKERSKTKPKKPNKGKDSWRTGRPRGPSSRQLFRPGRHVRVGRAVSQILSDIKKSDMTPFRKKVVSTIVRKLRSLKLRQDRRERGLEQGIHARSLDEDPRDLYKMEYDFNSGLIVVADKFKAKINDDAETLDCCECDYRCHNVESRVPESAIHQHILGSHVKCLNCPVCHKNFKGWAGFKLCISLHKNEERFICEICGKNYSTNMGLRAHRWTHLNEEEKANVLKEGIGPNSPYLVPHYEKFKSLPEEEQRVQCETCGKCVKKTQLKNHEKLHSEEGTRNSVCTKCGKRMTIGSFRYHKKYVCIEGDAPITRIECPRCNTKKTFKHKEQLRMHMAKYHSKPKND